MNRRKFYKRLKALLKRLDFIYTEKEEGKLLVYRTTVFFEDDKRFIKKYIGMDRFKTIQDRIFKMLLSTHKIFEFDMEHFGKLTSELQMDQAKLIMGGAKLW